MNIEVKSTEQKTSPTSSWRMPNPNPMGGGTELVVTGERLKRYLAAGKFACEYGQTNAKSKAKVSAMIGMNNSRFNQWMDGTYTGDFHAVTEEVEAWVKSNSAMANIENMVQDAPE